MGGGVHSPLVPTKEPCRCCRASASPDSLGPLDWIDIITGGVSRGWCIWTTAWTAFGLGWGCGDLAWGLSFGLAFLVIGPVMYPADEEERAR